MEGYRDTLMALVLFLALVTLTELVNPTPAPLPTREQVEQVR